jgi:dienelactone hydrolase
MRENCEGGSGGCALHEEANHDVEAALARLKARPDIDPGRIVMSGVSFGGIQTSPGFSRAGSGTAICGSGRKATAAIE